MRRPLAGELDVHEGEQHLSGVFVLAVVEKVPLAALVGRIPFEDVE